MFRKNVKYKVILLWFSIFVCFAWMGYWKTIYKAANLREFKVGNLRESRLLDNSIDWKNNKKFVELCNLISIQF